MKIVLHEVVLPLRHQFTIAHESRSEQRNLVVELEENGLKGYGEGAAIGYYGVGVGKMVDSLEAVRRDIEKCEFYDPVALWDTMIEKLGENRFALCALDEAAHDLWGKKAGKAVWEMWGLELKNLPRSNYTIGMDSVDKMVAKMKEFPRFPYYKIKLGMENDVEIIRELRRHTDAVFRVDANTAWGVEETIDKSRALKELGVEFIEQPLKAEMWKGMAEVTAKSVLPIIADESCILEEDVERCAECFDGVNIKLTKAGGLTPARRMIAQARKRGLKVMVGCMTETTVGISAIAQLLPLIDYVDMDGALLLDGDVAEGVRVVDGEAVFSGEAGTGVQWIGM